MAKRDKKKKTKKPHPAREKLDQGPPTAEQVARGQGTAGILAALPPMRARAGNLNSGTRGHAGGPNSINSSLRGGVGGGARIIGGVVAGKIHASGDFPVHLDGDVMVVEGTRLTADVGATIDAKSAFLGDRFVKDVQLATHHVGGITSTQISSRELTIVSATGGAPDRDVNHQRVGDAIAAHLGGRHLVVPEKPGESGARLRDGTRDPQVDVFLQAHSGRNEDDRKLQVVMLPAVAEQLGEHDVAIEYVLNEAAIAQATALKDPFDGKDSVDLVVSCPVPIGDPTREGLLAAAGGFDMRGYARLWLVDARGWVALLAG